MSAISAIIRYGICGGLFMAALGLILFTTATSAGILVAIGAAVTSRALIIGPIQQERSGGAMASEQSPSRNEAPPA